MAHPGGRPRKKFDLKNVELHGRLGSSFEDMAAMFDCSLATISLHMNDANSEFAKAYKKGAARTSGLKRAKQIKMAAAQGCADVHLGWEEPAIHGDINNCEIIRENKGA